MKAVVIHQFGDANQLKLEDVAIPVCGKDEVLVRVRATSVNPIDWKIRTGSVQQRMPIEFPFILGRDIAGEVVEKHGEISEFPAGTRVMALGLHSYAEFVSVKADELTAIPQQLSFEQAGALPLILLTGTQLIERAIKPESGQTVLVTGALGSVGRAALHAAKKLGARVLAGVRASQTDEAASLGADQIVAIDDEDELGKLAGLDAIADTVGGETISKLLKALKKGGVVGSVTGPPAGVDRYNVRVEAFMAQPDAAMLARVTKQLAKGDFVIPIGKMMPLKDVQEAHKLAEAGNAGGKIVLVP